MRDSRFWHPVAHLAVCMAGGGRHESGLPAGFEEDAAEASLDGLTVAAKHECDEVKEGMWLEPGFAAKEDQRIGWV